MSLPDAGSQQFSMCPYSRSYRLAAVPQVTRCSNCLTPRLIPISRQLPTLLELFACISARTARKTAFLMLCSVVAVETCLFAKQLLCICLFCGCLLAEGLCAVVPTHHLAAGTEEKKTKASLRIVYVPGEIRSVNLPNTIQGRYYSSQCP
jgi:hypothetical protein